MNKSERIRQLKAIRLIKAGLSDPDEWGHISHPKMIDVNPARLKLKNMQSIGSVDQINPEQPYPE